jgi:hypothetical protein
MYLDLGVFNTNFDEKLWDAVSFKAQLLLKITFVARPVGEKSN